jgi:transposase
MAECGAKTGESGSARTREVTVFTGSRFGPAFGSPSKPQHQQMPLQCSGVVGCCWLTTVCGEEEVPRAAWLYDVLKPHVHELVVCNPRRNALLKEGSKSDKVDARKLSELLRAEMLRPVYHGENGLRTLRELARSYETISKDLRRVMNRLKALYRSWGIPCAGTRVYAPRDREQWLNKMAHAGVRRRAELFYQHLDGLQVLRRQVRSEFLAESRKHKAMKILRQIPSIGPIRAALLLALMQTPYRFRSKRQLWTYSGLGVETHDSAQHCYVDGRLQRSKKPQQVRGLKDPATLCCTSITL